MDEATRRAYDIELRLRSLATDILEHEGCDGCRYNAAQALEYLGTFEETIERLGIEDPREAQKRRWDELRARAAAGQPPHLRLEFEAEIVVREPSQEMQDRIWSVVNEAVWAAVGEIPGASVVGSGGAMRME